MVIVSKGMTTKSVITGRLSDGSDREILTEDEWEIIFNENGHKYCCSFDHEPTEEEIAAADKQDITEPMDLIEQLTTENESLRTQLETTSTAVDFILTNFMPI